MAGGHHRLDGHEFEWTLGVGDAQEAWRAAIHGVSKSQTWLSNWTEHWMGYSLITTDLFNDYLIIIFTLNFYSKRVFHLANSTVLCTLSVQFSSVQSLSRVRLFSTPWIAARQASLSITNSGNSLKLTAIESVMPSSHLILCCPLFLLPPIPPSIRVFSSESTLHMR